MTHKELVEIAYKWVLRRARCGIALKELDCASNGEIPDVLGFASWGHSVLVECKVSRTDFLCDKKKAFRLYPEQGMGKFRFYCCPTGMIKKEELPEGWGLVYVSEKKKATLVYAPFSPCNRVNGDGFKLRNIISEHQFLYSALRRLFIRGLAPRIYDKEYQARMKVDDIIKTNEPDTTISPFGD